MPKTRDLATDGQKDCFTPCACARGNYLTWNIQTALYKHPSTPPPPPQKKTKKNKLFPSLHKGKGGLTEKMRKRLTCSARCAIKMRSREEDKSKALTLLKRDLINGPYHCFGHHSNCSPDFCQAVRDSRAAANRESQPAGNGNTCTTEITDDYDEDADITCKINMHDYKVGMCIALIQD